MIRSIAYNWEAQKGPWSRWVGPLTCVPHNNPKEQSGTLIAVNTKN